MLSVAVFSAVCIMVCFAWSVADSSGGILSDCQCLLQRVQYVCRHTLPLLL